MGSTKLAIFIVTRKSGVAISLGEMLPLEYVAAFTPEGAIEVVRTRLLGEMDAHRVKVAENEQQIAELRAQGKESEAVAFQGSPLVSMRAHMSIRSPGKPGDWEARELQIPGFMVTVRPR